MAHSIVIFGASGDLTSRKLIPALYSLFKKKRLPADTRVVGFSRSPFTNESWRASLTETTKKFSDGDFDEATWNEFAKGIYYHAGDIEAQADFDSLATLLQEVDCAKSCTRVYYLATAPHLYATAVSRLGSAGLASEETGPRRVVIEKPFGTDLKSARSLNEDVHRVFREHQVYRIDHYLGKETVQNLLVLRFANSIFEPLWNRNYVDHVQITVAEEVAVGSRGAYYEQSGVVRDMLQNHLLQLLMITAMEAPARFEADLVRDEKVKVLRAIRRSQPAVLAQETLRGQYQGYRQEKGVPADSQVATFAAVKLQIDNWRWKGVPFYLRSGKEMSCRTTQIVIKFREPPHSLFELDGDGDGKMSSNQLVIQVQPAEGIQLEFLTKVPDAGMQVRMTDLDFRFRREFAGQLPDAYQRLLLDAFNGEASLFARSDEVEEAWSIVDPILACWNSDLAPPLHFYAPGEWGPSEATEWMRAQGRDWFDVCPVIG